MTLHSSVFRNVANRQKINQPKCKHDLHVSAEVMMVWIHFQAKITYIFVGIDMLLLPRIMKYCLWRISRESIAGLILGLRQANVWRR